MRRRIPRVSPGPDFLTAFRPRILHAFVLGLALAVMDTLRSFPTFTGESGALELVKFLVNLTMANSLGTAMTIAAITWAEQLRVKSPQRFPLMAVTVLVSASVATMFRALWGYLLQPAGDIFGGSEWISVSLYLFWMSCTTGALAAFYYEFWERAAQSAARLRSAELERQGIEQRVVESRLSVMKARIEPAFLFNSIATVQKLYRGNTDAAEGLLDDLIVYLRAALPQMRGSSSSLGDEIHLASSYLKLHDAVFEGRLEVAFDVPESAREISFPPMVLLPLVEDAVHRASAMTHPALAIAIAISVDDAALRVAVADNCPLTRLDAGSDAALMSQEQSLAAFFGDAARLARSAGAQGGTRVTFEIPRAYDSRDPR
jgi:sensor histidine kinase YesM